MLSPKVHFNPKQLLQSSLGTLLFFEICLLLLTVVLSEKVHAIGQGFAMDMDQMNYWFEIDTVLRRVYFLAYFLTVFVFFLWYRQFLIQKVERLSWYKSLSIWFLPPQFIYKPWQLFLARPGAYPKSPRKWESLIWTWWALWWTSGIWAKIFFLLFWEGQTPEERLTYYTFSMLLGVMAIFLYLAVFKVSRYL